VPDFGKDVTKLVDTGVIAGLLAVDPVWSAYALADLQPAMAPYCRWLVHTNGTANAVALVFDGLETPALFTEGDPPALEAVLAGADLPARVYLTVREEHVPVVYRRFDHHDRRHMWRMVLAGARGEGRIATDGTLDAEAQRRGESAEKNEEQVQAVGSSLLREPLSLRASASEISVSARRLTAADVPSVRALLAHGGSFAPDAFAEYQVTQGVFFGVEDGAGGLAAVGGTHIVDYTSGVAAIGNMYTRPDCRGRGYGGAVLTAIVDEVRANGATTIVLNVDQRNTGARRLYEHHGFTVHCPYIEGVATVRT